MKPTTVISCLFLSLTFLCNMVAAQTVSLQVFNAASGITLDTVDVYINATKIDNLPLGSFSAALQVPPGNTTITINAKTSTSVSNQVLSSKVENFTWSSGGANAYHIFVLGVETPSQYAPNPYGQFTGVHTWIFPKGKPGAVPQGKISLGVLTHFAPDLPTVHCKTRKDTLIGRDVPFDGLSDVTINPLVSIGNQILDITDSATTFNYYASFEMPLNMYAGKKILFPLITGFLNPAANKNGMPLSVFLIDWFDTTGGPALKLNRIPLPKGSFQFIHNSATLSLDTIDVYINGTKYNTDNIAFRKGSGQFSVDAGLYHININRKNSTDSGNLVVKRFTAPIIRNETKEWMLIGLDSASSYASNPNGKNRNLDLLPFDMPYNPFSGTQVSFIQAATDAPGLIFQPRTFAPISSDLTNYADVPTRTSVISVLDSLVDLIYNESSPPLRSFVPKLIAPNYAGRIAFTSGFLNPSSNKNGASLALVFMDSAGNSIVSTPVIGARFLHNAADTSIPKVDVWIDNDPAFKRSNLSFRTCSEHLAITPGIHKITVMKPGSTDPTNISNQLLISDFDFKVGKDYIFMLSGVVDTSKYAPNPDSLSIRLNLTPIDNFSESNKQSSFRFINGVTDGKTMIHPITIFNTPAAFAPYATYIPRLSEATPPFNISLRSKDSSSLSIVKIPYSLMSSLIFSSGFASPTNNPKSGAPLKFFVLYQDNSVQELVRVVLPKVQFLNLSADVEALDIYSNQKLLVKGLKQYNISPTIELYPNVDYQIAYTMKDSGLTKVFQLSAMNFPEGAERTYITYGLRNPSNFKANPNGYSTNFQTFANVDVKRTPKASGSCEIGLFMSCTDLSYTPVKNYSPSFLMHSVGNYGFMDGFKSIADGKSGTITWQLMDKDKKITLNIVEGKLTNRSGLSGIAFLAGFSDTAWQNPFGEKPQSNRPLRIMIAWPDQQIDTLTIKEYTSVENLMDQNTSVYIYPVPASSTLAIKSNIPFSSVVIYSIAGVKVLEENFQEQSDYKLSVSGLKSGIYFLKIKGDNQQEYYQKIVIDSLKD